MEHKEQSAAAAHGLDSYLERFGLRDFRPGQLEVIRALLDGRDCLCIMPTGGGKSLCYQLPSLVRSGTTLVVSPLIALMKDQVDSLVARGIRASFVNSSLSPSEQHQRLQNLAEQRYDLLYVAPERFRSRLFLEAARAARIGLLAVDEAHCISEWGHDFRHDYSRLGEYRTRLGNPQTIALSATATQEVRTDICEQLRLEKPATLIAGFSRPNLHLAVAICSDTYDKHEILTRFLRRNLGCGIIYAATRKACEALVTEVALVSGRNVVLYHGGLENEERRRAQESFMSGDAEIAIATNAFGMGIDKADLRFVIHYHFPGSMEAYYQEAGRAGRDGQPAECLMLYSAKDRWIQDFFIESAYPAPDVVRRVYEFLRTHPDDPVEMTQLEIRTELGLKISNEGVGTCERLLEKAGAIERLEPQRNLAIVRILGDLPTLVDLLPRQARTQRQVLRHAERAVGDQRGDDIFFSPNAWCTELKISLATLTRTLKELIKLKGFDYVPPFRGRAVRALDRDLTFDQLQIDFANLERRKQADYDKLNRITRFAQIDRCRQRIILEYFGDPAARDCGNCDVCQPLSAWTTDLEGMHDTQPPTSVALANDPGVHRTVRIVLSAVARAQERVGKSLLSGMLQGSRATKIQKLKLDRLSTFGMLSHLTQSDVNELLDACVEQGWLQQFEVERFRPVVRLTDAGRQLMREAQARQEALYLPLPLLAKITAHEDAARRKSKKPAAPEEAKPGRLPTAKPQCPAPSRGRSAPDRDSPEVDYPEFYWTWRLLKAGFSADDTLTIRGVSQATFLEHALQALDAGYPVESVQLFSHDELVSLALEAPGDAENLLRSDTAARTLPPKMLLFLKTRSARPIPLPEAE